MLIVICFIPGCFFFMKIFCFSFSIKFVGVLYVGIFVVFLFILLSIQDFPNFIYTQHVCLWLASVYYQIEVSGNLKFWNT